jgi:hypothetical protein
MTEAQELYNQLNERQQAYLKAVYQFDQEAENYERSAWSDGRQRRPADEWRWLPYTRTPDGYPPPLQSHLADLGMVDPGTGSTFNALETRGLILCKNEWHGSQSRLESWLFVRMTPLGRKVVRAATGQASKPKLPAGTLQEWQWAALALVYAAGDEGLEKYHGPGRGFGEYGRVSWKTWLRLRDYKAGDLVQERIVPGSEDLSAYPHPKMGEYRMYITEFGKQYYEREKERYQERYQALYSEGKSEGIE